MLGINNILGTGSLSFIPSSSVRGRGENTTQLGPLEETSLKHPFY
jgi:hypothetical protein